MGYVAKDFDLPAFNVTLPSVYGCFKQMEVSLDVGVCRLDLHWFSDKEGAQDPKVKALDVWSYAFPPEFIDQLFKTNSNQSAFGVAYSYIRTIDERFKNIEDDF